MSYHFGANEYNHWIGKTLGNFVIKKIEYSPDSIYRMTDGHAGNPHLLTLSNGETFPFRQFQEAINKYGSFTPLPIYTNEEFFRGINNSKCVLDGFTSINKFKCPHP